MIIIEIHINNTTKLEQVNRMEGLRTFRHTEELKHRQRQSEAISRRGKHNTEKSRTEQEHNV